MSLKNDGLCVYMVVNKLQNLKCGGFFFWPGDINREVLLGSSINQFHICPSSACDVCKVIGNMLPSLFIL